MKMFGATLAGAICLAMAWTAAAQQTASEQDWIELFNGKDLTGWTQKNGTATYTIETGGVICGTTAEGSPNSFLCTDREFGDFELEFDVKVDQQLNSGVQIRSKAKPQPDGVWGRVNGPQVEIEASGEKGAEAGYIYGEATGRGWLVPKDKLIPHKKFKDGQWNHYRVIARGPQFQTFINGELVIDLTDDKIYESHPQGFIGLQVHSIGKNAGPYQVRWKSLRLRELK